MSSAVYDPSWVWSVFTKIKIKGKIFIFMVNGSILSVISITVGVRVRFRHPVTCQHSRLETYRRGSHVASDTSVRGHRSRDVDRVTS